MICPQPPCTVNWTQFYHMGHTSPHWMIPDTIRNGSAILYIISACDCLSCLSWLYQLTVTSVRPAKWPHVDLNIDAHNDIKNPSFPRFPAMHIHSPASILPSLSRTVRSREPSGLGTSSVCARSPARTRGLSNVFKWSRQEPSHVTCRRLTPQSWTYTFLGYVDTINPIGYIPRWTNHTSFHIEFTF